MAETNDVDLELELIRMMQRQPRPLHLEEIFSLLYEQRDGSPELMAMTRERTLEMRRVKGHLDKSVFRGLLETSWENGKMCYRAQERQEDKIASAFQLSVIREGGAISFASRPKHFLATSNFNDRLLSSFCVIALIVLASISIYFIFG